VDGESLVGRWDVDRLSPEFGLGAWSDSLSAYVLYAYPAYGGTLVHYIARDPEIGELRCDGHYALTLEAGQEHRVPLQCQIDEVAPSEPTPAAATPAPAAAPESDSSIAMDTTSPAPDTLPTPDDSLVNGR
jgi:hypothetical protein